MSASPSLAISATSIPSIDVPLITPIALSTPSPSPGLTRGSRGEGRGEGLGDWPPTETPSPRLRGEGRVRGRAIGALAALSSGFALIGARRPQHIGEAEIVGRARGDEQVVAQAVDIGERGLADLLALDCGERDHAALGPP